MVSGAYGFSLSFSTLLPGSPSHLEVTCHCVFLRRQLDGSRRSPNLSSLSSLRGDSFFRAKTGCAGATIPPPASERKEPRLCDWRSVWRDKAAEGFTPRPRATEPAPHAASPSAARPSDYTTVASDGFENLISLHEITSSLPVEKQWWEFILWGKTSNILKDHRLRPPPFLMVRGVSGVKLPLVASNSPFLSSASD